MEVPLRVRIYLEDTDAGGIVYNASYMRFMERARTEQLRAAGFEQSQTFAQDISFVVYSMNMRFHSPVHLDDEILVDCRLNASSAASLTFIQEVRTASDNRLCCSAEVLVACIKLSTKRPCRIPRGVIEALAGPPDELVG